MIPFQYFLKKSDTEYYTLDAQGGVSVTNVPTPQDHAPIGWADLKITFARNTKYWGVFREYSVPQQFVKGAAKILRNILYTEGIEGICILEIKMLNPSNWGTTNPEYEPLFSGNLDFSNCSDERDYFEINVMDRGLAELLKSREDVEFEIPLNDPDALTILLDGVNVKSSGSWYPGNYSAEAGNGVLASPIPYANDGNTTNPVGRTVPFYNNGEVIQIAPFIRPHSQKGRVIAPPVAILSFPFIPGEPSIDDGEYMLYANTNLKDVTITGQLNYSTITPNVAGTKTIKILASVIDKALPFPSIQQQITLHTFTTTAVDTEVGATASLSGTFDMPQGTYLIITIKGNCTALSGPEEFDSYFPIEGGSFKLTYLAKVAPTTTKAFRWITLAKKLGQALGGYNVVSDFMSNPDTSNANRFANWDNSPYNTCVFSGDAARGKPNAKIKTTISDHHKDGFSRWVLGVSVEEDTLRFEPINYFLKDEKIATIGEINNFRLAPYQEVLFNDQKVGFEAKDIRNTVGRNEFNTTTEFIGDAIKRVRKEDNIVSGYVASVYVIEQSRAETIDEAEEDNRFDNDTMLTEINPVPVSGQFLPFRPVGIISGVDDPAGMYNYGLTPGRATRRHLPRTRAMCDTGILKYQTTEKNPDLVSNFFAGQVVEAGDIPLDQNPYMGHDVTPWFQPYIYEFDCAPPRWLYNQIVANPYGYLEFSYNGYLWRGFILESSINPAKDNPNTFKLLAHPGDDLSKLVR